jgi:hypothetical protein
MNTDLRGGQAEPPRGPSKNKSGQQQERGLDVSRFDWEINHLAEGAEMGIINGSAKYARPD